jgi:protein-S-isoprenylcysteine O-methyltransferase Ste14
MSAPAIVGCLWLIFFVVWLIAASGAKRAVQRRRGVWIVRLIIFIIIFFALSQRNSRVAISHARLPQTPAVQATGIVLTALGIAFAFWARFYLGRNWGMPMSVQENAELVTTGPYAYVRNPIYTGMLLAMIGSTIVIGLWWLAILAVSAVYFVYSAKQEEKLLVQQFPGTFPAYKARTRMLVPFLF